MDSETETTGHSGEHAQKPFRVEVSIDAPRDTVFRALTDTDEIRRWFGWDYPGLDEEIKYIFVDHAKPEPSAYRIDFPPMQTIDLLPDGAGTIVRVVCPGTLEGTGWEDLFDAMEEGWRTFFHQLKWHLERGHEGQDRRTVYLSGKASAPEVLAAVEAAAPGREFQASRHQRAVAPDAAEIDLVSVLSSRPLDDAETANVSVTLTTYGLDDAAFDEVQREWKDRWSTLVKEEAEAAEAAA